MTKIVIRTKEECKQQGLQPIDIEEEEGGITEEEWFFDWGFDTMINTIRNEIKTEYASCNNEKAEAWKKLIDRCDTLEQLYKDGCLEKVAIAGYYLGSFFMLEKLKPHLQRKYSGANLSAKDPIYWGEKINEYVKSEKAKGVTPKIAVSNAYKYIKMDWKKEYPNTGTNPAPSTDTLKKYWNMYLNKK